VNGVGVGSSGVAEAAEEVEEDEVEGDKVEDGASSIFMESDGSASTLVSLLLRLGGAWNGGIVTGAMATTT